MNQIDAACRMIAKQFNIPVSSAISIDPTEAPRLQILQFCERHQIGVRELDPLKRRANGDEPMIAFSQGEPAVWLPNFWGKYEAINPETGAKSKIPGEISGPIFSFYCPLPDQIDSPMDLFRFGLKGKGGLLLLILGLSIFSSCFSLFPLFSMKWAILRIELQGKVPFLNVIAAALIVSTFGSAFFFYLRNRALIRLDGLLASCIQPALWNRFFNLRISFFRKIEKGALMQKALSLEEMRGALSRSLSTAVFLALLALMYLLAMCYFSLSFTLITLPAIGLFFYLFVFLLRKRSSSAEEKRAIDSEIQGFLDQCFHSVIRIRAACAEDKIMAVWQRLIEEREKLERNKDKTRILIAIVEIAFPFASLASVLVFWIFYWDVVRVSDIFPFVIALLLLSSTAQDLAFAVFEAFSAFPVMKKGEKIFMEPKEMGEADPGKLKGAISFKNVSFRFEKEAPLLFDDISFEINARERVGILGESGSGRSTLIRLILGFETPENGVIALDERDLSTLRLKEVRRQIGSVFGVEGIFGASIFDNIDAGRGCTEDQIEKALNHSGFAEQMKRFPMGLHTLLPDGGETLSGSQKQKLLLARALAFDPAIIIIDETIDTLDLLSKEAILANLRGIAATQLIVSHDEELLRKHVDKIYKLDHGKIKCQR